MRIFKVISLRIFLIIPIYLPGLLWIIASGIQSYCLVLIFLIYMLFIYIYIFFCKISSSVVRHWLHAFSLVTCRNASQMNASMHMRQSTNWWHAHNASGEWIQSTTLTMYRSRTSHKQLLGNTAYHKINSVKYLKIKWGIVTFHMAGYCDTVSLSVYPATLMQSSIFKA